MPSLSIIEKAIEDNQFDTLDDGFVYYWPTGDGGCLSAHSLREIADYLDTRNETWSSEIDEYFNSNQPGLPAPG